MHTETCVCVCVCVCVCALVSVALKIQLLSLHLLFVESLLARYLNVHAFTELHLDSIFKYGDDNTLPLEVKNFTYT